jgi:hypothetical protein
MSDIAEITYTIREAAKLAFNRQAELGDAELQDIVEAVARLTSILQRADAAKERVAA